MSHVGMLRWHSPKNLNDIKSWQKVINRKNFKVTASTKVFSNHFAAGYCSDICRIPTLYMKGYILEPVKHKQPSDRSADLSSVPKRQRQIYRDGSDDTVTKFDQNPQTPNPSADHDYDNLYESNLCARCSPLPKCKSCSSKCEIINSLLTQLGKEKEKCKALEFVAKKTQCFSIDDIKDNDRMVTNYTGLQNYDVFQWLYKRIKLKANNLNYSNSKNESKTGKKFGPKRKLNTRNELFLTLVRLRLGLTELDLAFRFKVSQSTVSNIWSTWIPFLGKELQPLIFWPTQEQNNRNYPNCFKMFQNTIGIIDCTEGALEKPSLAKAQAQTYSSYKSKNTWKKLICVTPSGTISFVSKGYGGCALDRYITETCGVLEKVKPGDTLMADKGFNISDLLVGKGAKLVIPPFLKDKCRFTIKNCARTSTVAKARIHVERAIARIKDFRILQGAIPLTMKDLLDDMFIIISAITNLAPPLVPL